MRLRKGGNEVKKKVEMRLTKTINNNKKVNKKVEMRLRKILKGS